MGLPPAICLIFAGVSTTRCGSGRQEQSRPVTTFWFTEISLDLGVAVCLEPRDNAAEAMNSGIRRGEGAACGGGRAVLKTVRQVVQPGGVLDLCFHKAAT